ncbi:hypothetical protein F5J12DRAFT_898169 [Pisolithus orientalis]|uniref:uncharacterized protein n=1 Tax=Pisolithus orientalis TaxID=936130 RepID=UPI00222405B9|nr:uncharacterized protein F5J12DRAFT_898169 [Pisolithus orientalis]KAI5988484.1 hypothetical protein F5J12DRAFT_898169 [Pisolithus orientalis]
MSSPLLGPCMSGVAPPSKTTGSSGIPLDDIINDPEAEIKDAGTARTLLDQMYMIHGEPASPEHISQALFYILQAKNVNNTLCLTIHATAFLIKELVVPALADSIIRAVTDKLNSLVLITISPHVGKILAAADNLEKIIKKASKNIQLLNARVTNPINLPSNAPTHSSINHLEGKVQSLVDNLGTVKSVLEVKNLLKSNAPPAPFPISYRDILAPATVNLNCLLRDGLYRGLDRLCPYKDKREPVWCLKCQ